MSIFEQLLGGNKRQEYEDFGRRYETGAPWDGIPDDEAMNRYQEVATRVPPDVYQSSAEDAFNRLSPQERREFARYLQSRAREQGVASQFEDLDRDGVDDRLQDPRELARVTSRMEQQQPGILGQLLGGGGGGGLGGVLGGALGGGGSAGGFGGSGGGQIFSNPIAKAAVLGITAMAAQRLMGGRR